MKFESEHLNLMEGVDHAVLNIMVKFSDYDNLDKLINKDGIKTIEIKKKSFTRSLSANAYLWVLLQKQSDILVQPKGDLYVKAIKSYGQFTSVILNQETQKQFIKFWNSANTKVDHTESLCEVNRTFNSKGVIYSELTCHFGTSAYTKVEFHNFLNGVVADCKDLGIETMTPNELQSLMETYNE